MEVNLGDVVLCEFYFSDFHETKLRPVLVFKDNLPFDDFVGIPLSSQIGRLSDDEIVITQSDLSEGMLPKRSKVMLRKTFVVSKQVIVKKYGGLTVHTFEMIHKNFCQYFECSGKC